jgi:hypothetical protein
MAPSDPSRLTATDKKHLKELVEGDFAAAEIDMRQLAEDVKASRKAALREEYAVRLESCKDVEYQLRRLKAKFRKGIDQLIDDAREDGVTVRVTDDRAFTNLRVEVYAEGFYPALQAVEESLDGELSRALNTLEKAKLATLRKVLISGLASEAEDLLDSIPPVDQILREAAAGQPSALL